MSDVVELGATAAAVVELQGVSVTYPSGHIALGEVSLTIQRGEFAFLVGPSGAGKSTLIGLLVRDVLPTAGEVHVAGFPVHRLSGVRYQSFVDGLASSFKTSASCRDEPYARTSPLRWR